MIKGSDMNNKWLFFLNKYALGLLFVALYFLSTDDMDYFDFGVRLKLGFVFFLFVFVGGVAFYGGRVFFGRMEKIKLYYFDVPAFVWIFLCVVACVYNGGGKNYAYTFAAILFFLSVQSSRLDFFCKNRIRIAKYMVISGIVLSFLGWGQFVASIAGMGKPFYVQQWWYDNLIPRINGLLYEPSYYSLVMSFFVIFSFSALGVGKKEKFFRKSLTVLFFVSSVALVISSSRTGVLAVAFFIPILIVYKYVFFNGLGVKGSFKLFAFFVGFSVLFFMTVGVSVNYLSHDIKRNYADSETNYSAAVKKEETKPQETKAEETKAEETKAEETKAEETKAEETKAEETKAEETNSNVYHQSVFAGTGLYGESNHSLAPRVESFFNTLEVARKNLLFGVGLGGISLNIAKINGEENLSSEKLREYEGLSPLIEMVAATGIIGGFAFSSWFLCSVVVEGKVFVRNETSLDSILKKSLCLSLLFQFFLMQVNQNILREYFWVNFFMTMIFIFNRKKDNNG